MAGEFDLQQQHGKARVRVARLWRGRSAGEQHRIVEWNVSISITSHALPAFTDGDNSSIVATDSIKNTVYALAKQCNEELSIEDFGIIVGQHFVRTYPKIVTGCKVLLWEKPWDRVVVDGVAHNHGFKLGTGKHTAEVIVGSSGQAKVATGLSDLSLLKTTQSGFEKFVRDKYSTLGETKERMMASTVTARWSYTSNHVSYQKLYEAVKDELVNTFFGPAETGTYSPSVQNTLYLMAKAVLLRYPEVESVYLNMPNIHFLPVNLPTVGVKFENDVFLPTDEPHGSIEACLTRRHSMAVSKL
jgi:urate oxidase